MNDKQKRGPGRPRKYETDAERKRAYRERKKKRLANISETLENLEERVGKVIQTETNQQEALLKALEMPRTKFSPSEIAEMSIDQLLEIRSILREWLEGYSNPIMNQLRDLIIPQTYLTFDDMGLFDQEDKQQEFDNYIPSVIEFAGLDSSYSKRRYFTTSARYASSFSLTEMLQQLVLLYLVEAEIDSRQREKIKDVSIHNLETRLRELESVLESYDRKKEVQK